MVSEIEHERKVLIDILNSEKLSGLPLILLPGRLQG